MEIAVLIFVAIQHLLQWSIFPHKSLKSIFIVSQLCNQILIFLSLGFTLSYEASILFVQDLNSFGQFCDSTFIHSYLLPDDFKFWYLLSVLWIFTIELINSIV